jgi:hypothetical protein
MASWMLFSQPACPPACSKQSPTHAETCENPDDEPGTQCQTSPSISFAHECSTGRDSGYYRYFQRGSCQTMTACEHPPRILMIGVAPTDSLRPDRNLELEPHAENERGLLVSSISWQIRRCPQVSAAKTTQTKVLLLRVRDRCSRWKREIILVMEPSYAEEEQGLLVDNPQSKGAPGGCAMRH